MPEDRDTAEQEDDLLDDGLSAVPGRKRIAELPMLASLYVQVIGHDGTVRSNATASCFATGTELPISSPTGTW
ncbi:hypothetical protein AB0C14_38670 [Microbispora hainanensis]|uniref:hypothetical protein n=1 Tax=Microbispora hainanensis TaxID=568844 RepID=UPI0033ECB818